MRIKMKGFVLLLATLYCVQVNGQEKNTLKFGDVTEKDFAKKAYTVDSNASAVVIADIGSSKIEGNNKSWFSLIHKHYKRVHILNKNGYDAANVSVALYSDGRDEEQIEKLKAVTYNFENGKVVQTKLDTKAGVFKDKIEKNRVIRKFTFPNVKEGSIIEYEYTIISDFLFNLQPWKFQGSYPCLWSEYNVALPDFFRYVFLKQGVKGFDISDRKEKREIFMVGDPKSSYKEDAMNIEANVSDLHWVIKNAPAIKAESYTYTIDNHIAKIDFQLSEQVAPLNPQRIMGSWVEVSKKLMESKDFGLQLTEDNYWLTEILAPVIKDGTSAMEKAKKIYTYVRDKFTCTNHNRMEMEQSLRSLVKSGNGTVAEINLLLVAMLRSADINTDPVILSTQPNGYAYYGYPVMSQYNYVVARANIGGTYMYMDASEPRLGFGYLPLRCYNSHARVINEAADPIELKSDLINEIKYTTVFIADNEKGKLAGNIQQSPGYYESLNLRDIIKGKGQAEVEKEIIKNFSPAIEISNFRIDSLDKYDNGIAVKYNFEMKDAKSDIIYMNPYFGEAIKDNPFKSAQRLYPVEMPYKMDQTYNLQIEIPQGYTVDEMPKPLTLKLNDKSEGAFEYNISQSGTTVSFRSRIRFTRSYFKPEEYQTLRDFFGLVVKKQSEQIVFKKKK
jgi:Domain of Unknown Function with PDB structure (DUF3857)/Transglutaminase-like superfamily/Domain of Unknown Function with PDB structure (DUF3858)